MKWEGKIETTNISMNQILGLRLLTIMDPSDRAELRFSLRSEFDNQCNQISIVKSIKVSIYGQLEIRLLDYKKEFIALLSCTDDLDAFIEIHLCKNGKEIYRATKISRYDTILKEKESTGIILLDHVVVAHQAYNAELIKLLTIQIDAPDEDPGELSARLSGEFFTGAWDFDPNNRRPGLWMIFASDAPHLAVRPFMRLIPKIDESPGSLGEAIYQCEQKRQNNWLDESCLAILDNALGILIQDFCHKDWNLVDRLALQFNHLPLSASYLWRAFARKPSAMAALAFRLSSYSKIF